MEHPDFKYLEGILIPIINLRKYRGWEFSGLKYDRWAQKYQVFLIKDGNTKEVVFFREWLDQAHDQGDSFLRFRFKKVISDALGVKDEDND